MANKSLKKPLGVRLSEHGIKLLHEMAARTGLSRTGILELAIREKAQRDGVEVEAATTGKTKGKGGK